MADEALNFERRPALAFLWAMRAQRIDSPQPGLFAFTFFAQGTRHILLTWIQPGRRGVGIANARPQGDSASGFVQRLRGKIENGKLSEAYWLVRRAPAHPTEVERRASAASLPADTREPTASELALGLELIFARGESRERILIDFDAQAPNLILADAHDSFLGAADEKALRQRFPTRKGPFALGRGRGVPMPSDLAHATQLAEGLEGQSANAELDGELRDLRQRGQAALKRAERKASAIASDLDRASLAPRLRREAGLLLRHLHTIPRGASHVSLEDDGVDPPERLEFALDPAHDANRNAQNRFDKARKLERGTDIGKQRLGEVTLLITQLKNWLSDVEAHGSRQRPSLGADPNEDLADLRARGTALGLGGISVKAEKKRGPQARTPYRTFVAPSGHMILVGKGAADNDTLTLNVARPHDHWLHARSIQGAHVVVPCERKSPISAELLIDAAHLAAHFSALRGEVSVEVQHTERRYVRKPRGAAPGSVIVEREKVLLVRVERERLQALLASERSPR